MKLLLAALLFITTSAYSQSSGFLLLKKKNKTIASYYPGSNIEFVSTNGGYLNCLINRIANDSLYLQEFITQRGVTSYGAYILDTIGSYHYKFHYNQVAIIGKAENKHFNLHGSGAALMGGGIVLTAASGVVYLVNRAKFSAPLLFASAGLGIIGYFLARGTDNSMKIGKKYKLLYLGTAQGKN